MMPLTFQGTSSEGLSKTILIFIYSLTYIKAAFFIIVHGLIEKLSLTIIKAVFK